MSRPRPRAILTRKRFFSRARRQIEREKGKKKRRKKNRRRKEEDKYLLSRVVAAHEPSSPMRRPHPRAILLPREETFCLLARGERSRRHLNTLVHPYFHLPPEIKLDHLVPKLCSKNKCRAPQMAFFCTLESLFPSARNEKALYLSSSCLK
ncbi:hypothetical protein BHM03_00015878 [Ensete ventricosum]|nr:hypothetical protein BHM03_00015878 [Ensete ventricosum]